MSAPAVGCTYIASYCQGKPNGWASYTCVDNVWKGGQAIIEPCDVPIEAGPDRIEGPRDAAPDRVDATIEPVPHTDSSVGTHD